jgi:hypothetical protein
VIYGSRNPLKLQHSGGTGKAAIWRRIDICLGVVFRRTQIVDANLARFQDLASSGGIYDDSVSPLQIMFGYTRATSEELRAIHNIDELDSGGARQTSGTRRPSLGRSCAGQKFSGSRFP